MCSAFIDNIWGVDLADMQVISKINKGIRFLLYVITIFSKNAWVIILIDRNGITITYAFQKKYEINLIASQTTFG